MQSRMVMLTTVVVALIWSMGTSQVPGVVSTDELNLQKLFIEANREKLLGQFEEAASLYEEVLAQDPVNDAAAYELSRVYLKLERYEDALTMADKAIRTDRNNPWYRMMKGDILEQQENYAGAIEVYTELTNIQPSENYYFIHLTDLLVRTNQNEKALEVLDELELINGTLPDVITYKVEILDEMGRYEQAQREIEKLIAIYPYNKEYLHMAALFANKAGNQSGAAEYYERILELDPTDSKANLGVASSYRAQGEGEEYLRSIKPLIENPAIELDVKINELIPYVNEYAQAPNPLYAEVLGGLISNLVEQHPQDAKAHALYGDFLYHSGNLPEAVKEYEKTLVIDKSVFEVWEQLLYAKAEMQDMQGVLATADKALDVYPNQGSIYYLSGLASAYLQDYNSALDQLQQALIMSGRDEQLRFKVYALLGEVYAQSGKWDKAIEAYEKALELDGNDIRLLASYAQFLMGNEEGYNKAFDMATKALSQAPNDPELGHLVAQIAFQQQNYRKAKEYMDTAMDYGAGNNPYSLELYGDILFSLDNIDEAVEYWQLAQEAGNESQLLKRKISERKLVH